MYTLFLIYPYPVDDHILRKGCRSVGRSGPVAADSEVEHYVERSVEYFESVGITIDVDRLVYPTIHRVPYRCIVPLDPVYVKIIAPPLGIRMEKRCSDRLYRLGRIHRIVWAMDGPPYDRLVITTVFCRSASYHLDYIDLSAPRIVHVIYVLSEHPERRPYALSCRELDTGLYLPVCP